ncbi:hypothetical protein SAMN04487967_0946 [Natronorubrum sediminis]|uniref:DUF8156 domain-containing protein n=1 Tax=Natronorubrum sediminis TaxID=640943 RepID=A0A1H6FRG1_9EURY|nr:hypothetical protein [Natronorubrum sediminis]SEH12748.1 hypothetical protein SAMN04487967_0946 [Natronorubrum sediminis]
MGRTNPTYRDSLRALESEWGPMRRALRREYQLDFDRLFDRGRTFADAAGHANPMDPERAFVLSLLLAHEVEIRRLRGELEEMEERISGSKSDGQVPDSRSMGRISGSTDEPDATSDGEPDATRDDEPDATREGPE